MSSAEIHVLAVDRPTNATFTSPSIRTERAGDALVEVLFPHTGDPVGTLRIVGGNFEDEATHHDVPFAASDVFVNGVALSVTAVTGLTHATTAPGTLSIADTLAADVRIRIKLSAGVLPLFFRLLYTRSSGGDAAQLIQARALLRAA